MANPNEHTVRCEQCGQKFQTKEQLQDHNRQHAGAGSTGQGKTHGAGGQSQQG